MRQYLPKSRRTSPESWPMRASPVDSRDSPRTTVKVGSEATPTWLDSFNRYTCEDDGGFGFVLGGGGDFGDFFYDVVAFHDFAKDGVLAGEPAGVGGSDEELAAVSVGAGVSHGELAGLLEAVGRPLGL